MKKLISSLAVALLILSSLSALQVHKGELESAKSDTIEFINYTGPHKKIETVDAIKGIGIDAGKKVKSEGIENNSRAGNRSKYYVIHCVDTSENSKLDADILFLGSDAQVDHIKNLRRIIAAYLSEAYGYSETDANTLSVFITVYNAVYRGNKTYFGDKYKEIVTTNLSSDCGLSVNYSDWPGKTEIVIPLYDVTNGGLSTVDTSVISDSKVVSSMKEDDDKNIESRKDMVDLKEREAEDAQTKAKDAQKQATEEQKKLNEEKEKTAQAKEDADAAEKAAEEARKEALENPDDEEAQKAAEEAEEAAQEAKEAYEEQKVIEEEQQHKTDEAREEAAEQQELADKKESEAQKERKEIAKDQNELQKEEAEKAKQNTAFGIMLVDEANLLSRLVEFNTETGETVKNSPVAQIRNRVAFEGGDGFIAIAGENSGNGAVKLVNIDSSSMEITKESKESVAEDSVLVRDGNDFYCVIDDNGKWVLGKYNENMELKLRSTIAVKSATPVMFTKAGIAVTDNSGKMQILSKDNLAPIAK